jgi:large subunit ribosomal protein L29
MRPEEIREMGDADIARTIEELKDRLFDLRMRGAYEELEDSSIVSQVRRDIARLLTIQSERDAARESKES